MGYPLSPRHQFSFRIDFRYDPFAPGESSHTLFASPFLSASLMAAAQGASLRIDAGGHTVIWPTEHVGQPLEPRRWYRLRINYAKDGNLGVKVTAWNKLTGWYDESMALSASGCVLRPVSTPVQSGTTAWVGYDGATQASRFSGLVDNVHLRNFAVTNDKQPDYIGVGCEVQP